MRKGVFNDDKGAIGSVRLSIVGGQGGRQPICESGCVLAFNGEIYNFLDLDRTTRSDTHALFRLLYKGGVTDHVLNSLNGVWAFCYSDAKHVYLVRDRFGEKPLYYTLFKDCLCFCSEIKGFLEIPGLELKITLPDMYPQLETTLSGKTIFEQVFEVPPGSYVAFDRKSGASKQRAYYSLLDALRKDRHSFDEEQFSSLVVDAVTLRTPNIPYSAYVSGGIDSAAIVGMLSPDQVLTCTDQIPGLREDQYADLVVARNGGVVNYTKMGTTYSVQDFVEMVYANDGPTTTFAAISEFLLAQSVRNKVVLSGMGVDEFFGGYGRHLIAYSNEVQAEIAGQYRYLISKAGSSSNPAQRYYRLINRDSPHPSLEHLVEHIFSIAQDPIAAMGVCDAEVSLLPLLSTSDKMNFWSGVEERSPFLDYRIVEYGLSLEANDKIRKDDKGLVAKYAFREAIKRFLPKEVYERRDKIGFSSRISEMLRGGWSPLVGRLGSLLKKEYPGEKYYAIPLSIEAFDRKNYQVFQIGITHLLFCQRMTVADVVKFLTR